MAGLLYLPNWCDVLIVLHKTPEHRRYCQRITKNVEATLNHVRAIVKELHINGLIKITPTKKVRHIHLTEKGKKVVESIINMKTIIK